MESIGLAQVDMREAPDARVVLEVTLVRLARSELDGAPDALAERVARLEQALSGREAMVRRPEPAPATPPPGPSDQRAKPTIGALRRQRAEQGAAPEPAPPPTNEAPPAGEPTPATLDGSVPDRDTLVEAWGDHLLRALPARAKVLYSSGRFVSVEGSTAVFAVPNPGYLGRCEEMRPLVEEALSGHFKAALGLRLVVDDQPGSAPQSAPRTGRARARGPERPRATTTSIPRTPASRSRSRRSRSRGSSRRSRAPKRSPARCTPARSAR